MPYISASIVFSLLAKMVPALEQVAKEGAQGQKKINQWTRWATVPICIVQAFFIVKGLIAQDVYHSTRPVIEKELFETFGYQTGVVLILTNGTLFIMWIGEKISEHGIGQGTSLIIMAGIVARVPQQLAMSVSGDSEDRTQFLASIAGL